MSLPAAVPAFSTQIDDNWKVLGPSGGDVRVITFDPRDANRLYLGTLDGQVHTSMDGGRSWRLLVNLNKPGLILDQLFVDSRDSRLIYASGHRGTSPGGFFKSSDKGLTWKEATELKSEAIYSMAQSPVDPNMLLCGAASGLWASRDSGDSWEKIASETTPVNINSLAMDPRNISTIYAGTQYRPYKTNDGGRNWKLIRDGMIDDSDVFAITIDPRNPEHVISSACSGIYESFNSGERWSKIQGIPNQSRRTRDLLQHPTRPGTIYAATTEGFWRTTDGGKNWSLTTQRNLEVNSIAVHPELPDRVFIATNTHGVMASDDSGATFSPANADFSSRFTFSVVPDVHREGRLYAITLNIGTGGGYVFTSADAGRSWQPARDLDPNRVRPFVLRQDAADPNVIYLGTNVGIFRSLDRGGTWKPLVASEPGKNTAKAPVKRSAKSRGRLPAKKSSVKSAVAAAAGNPGLIPRLTGSVRSIQILPDGKGLLAGTDMGLYRSNDPAKGWEKLDLGVPDENIFALHVAPLRPETIWVGTAAAGVAVSHDGGLTWTRTGGAVDNVPVSSITSDPKRPDRIYVGTTQTFYLSRNGGDTWVRRGGNLPLGDYNSILINPENPDELLISSSLESDGGIYVSADAGDRWKRLDTNEMNLPSRRFWTIAQDPHNPHRIFAATHSSGVYAIERVAAKL
jgi:photosystem II stability/assembly factor-like uncharacterized protein